MMTDCKSSFLLPTFIFFIVMIAPLLSAENEKPPSGFPEGVTEIRYTSSGDQSQQPALFWKPDKAGENGKVPLLVALHTWSGTYQQGGGETAYAKWCQKLGWVFIHPNFRGANWTPKALGSDLAVADIVSAVEYARANAAIDETRIYCIGVSGGGHASLLMAGRHPEIWAGVSAWCGISDIAEWHRQCIGTKFEGYARQIEKALGGPPDNALRKASARKRSPVTWLHRAAEVPLDINHGINDGRAGSVPFIQSLYAWNQVVQKEDRFSTGEISEMYQTRAIPPSLVKFKVAGPDPLYGDLQPLLRRTSGNTRLTLFNGGHEMVHEAALNWLAAQRKGRPANWNPQKSFGLPTGKSGHQSGK